MEIDVLSLDQKIQEKLRNEEEKIILYKNKIKDIEELNIDNLDEDVHARLEETKSQYEKNIKCIEHEQNYNFYINESTPIIQKYKEILKKPIKVSFMAKKSDANINLDEEKAKLIANFLNIAKINHLQMA